MSAPTMRFFLHYFFLVRAEYDKVCVGHHWRAYIGEWTLKQRAIP